MAPEQAGGKSKDIGPAVDVYALGAILYECLTGRPPFQAETTLDTLLKVASEEPVPPHRLNPRCPRDLETICLKCLEKDPKRRYPAAAALAEDLQRYRDDKPLLCRPSSRLERFGRRLRKRRELMYLAVGMAAAVSVSLVALAFLNHGTGRTMPMSQGVVVADRLPDDLDLLPRDAHMFFSIRADISARQDLGDLKDRFPIDWYMQVWMKSSIQLREVERVMEVQISSREDIYRISVIALKKPCDPAQIVRNLTGGAPSIKEEINGKRIYLIPANSALGKDEFCAYSDRVLLLGPSEAIGYMLEQHTQGRDNEPQHAALALAAQGHSLVYSLHPTPKYLQELAKELQSEHLESLNECSNFILRMDLSEPNPKPNAEQDSSLAVHLTLQFPDESCAKRGHVELNAWMRERLEKTIASLLQAPPGLRILPQVIPQTDALTSIRQADWRQEGSAVVLTATFHWTAKDVQRFHRDASIKNLQALGQAMRKYVKKMGNFPPAVVYSKKDDKPLYSWRVLLLPYLDQQPLYDQFHLDEPWDSDHNKKLLAKMPTVYAAPCATNEKNMVEQTYYQIFFDSGAAFEGKQGLRSTFFTDGTSNTLLAAEAAEAVPWTSPRDLAYQPGKALPRLGGHLQGGFNALLADFKVHWIKQTISDKMLRDAITHNDGQPLGPDW
jgi:hypothetical protein